MTVKELQNLVSKSHLCISKQWDVMEGRDYLISITYNNSKCIIIQREKDYKRNKKGKDL